MIAIQLGGGIGNQLFQYAAARALALRLRVPLALDLRLFDNHAARRYALDAFAIETAEIDRNAFPASARHGLYPGQSDLGYRFIQCLEFLGLAWNVQLPQNLPPRAGLKPVRESATSVLNSQAHG